MTASTAGTYIDPSNEQFDALEAMDLDGPARHVEPVAVRPRRWCRAIFQVRRSRGAVPAGCGAKIQHVGHGVATVIRPDEWDMAILAEYPSVRAFSEMFRNPDYLSAIRAGALADSRLYCTQERSR